MKKLLTLLVGLLALNAPAAYVRYSSTNIWGTASTNAVKVTPIGAPINANGTFVTRGTSFRIYPDINGTVTTNLSAGNYLVTNSELRTNICFADQTAVVRCLYFDVACQATDNQNFVYIAHLLHSSNSLSNFLTFSSSLSINP